MPGTVIGFPRFVEIRERHRARVSPVAGRAAAPVEPLVVTIEGEAVVAVEPPLREAPAAGPEMDGRRGPAHRGRPWGGDGLRPFPARP